MPAIRRMLLVLVASASTIGFLFVLGFAPTASAAPCTAPEAMADPPASAPDLADPGMNTPTPRSHLPTGRRPRGTNDSAPLPKLGPLISSLLKPSAGTKYSAPLQQQAAPLPSPTPPAAGTQQAPNAQRVTPPAAAVPVTPAPAAVPAAPGAPDAMAAVGGSNTSLVDWVTGPNSPNKTLERFGISGTDLGIMWDNGDPADKQTLMAFGDTFGYCRADGKQWRYNTLMRSQDHAMTHGIDVQPGVVSNRYSGSPVSRSGYAKQVIPSIKWAQSETGVIPTAGISVGRMQYVNFMSIREWGRDGEWSTNYSAIAESRDNGQTWGVYPGTVRPSGPDGASRVKYVPGNEHFQMGSYVKGTDGYLYSFGTPSGRGGSAYLSRVPPNYVPDLTKYQYWNGDGEGHWVNGDPNAATPVIPGPVAEMSSQYNTYLKKYLVMYTNGANDVVARTAPNPQGPWTPEQLLVSNFQMPGGIYAPMMHPWSTGKDVYFNLSMWSAYNVMLMHTTLQ